MPFALLIENPLVFLAWIVAILAALSFHEFSHALVSDTLGDHTARRSGRLTLNPLAHIDPMGFFLLILIGFGWGRPVPFDPFELRYPKWGPAMVAFAGPLSNFVLAVISGGILKSLGAFTSLPPENMLVQFLHLLFLINIILMTFNLIPVPPLDGSKFLLSALSSPKYIRVRYWLETRGPFLLLSLILIDSLLGIGIFGAIFRLIFSFAYRLV